MSSDLEAKLRTMVRRGHMVHLSLSASADGKAFEASFRDASSGPTRFGEGTDPVDAIKKVLKAPAASAKPEETPRKPARRSDFI